VAAAQRVNVGLAGNCRTEVELNTGKPRERQAHDGLDRRRAPHQTDQIAVSEVDAETTRRLYELHVTSKNPIVLPRNFSAAESEDAFVFEEITPVIQKLGRKVGLAVGVPGAEQYRTIHEYDANLMPAVLVFASSFFSDASSELAVSLLKELGRYVLSRWGSRGAETKDVALEVLVTKEREAKRINYSGPPEGLDAVVRIARTVFDHADGEENSE